MAKSHRDHQKRRLGYVLGILDRSIEHTLDLQAEFNDAIGLTGREDDYEEQLAALAKTNSHAQLCLLLHLGSKTVLAAQYMFESFAREAWGGVPDKIERWTNTGQDYKRKHG